MNAPLCGPRSPFGSRRGPIFCVLFTALAALVLGCEGDPSTSHHGPTAPDLSEIDAEDDSDGETTTAASSGPCQDGQTRACHVDLGVHGSVKTCFDGVQTCSAGEWGPCGDPPAQASLSRRDSRSCGGRGAGAADEDASGRSSPCAPRG